MRAPRCYPSIMHYRREFKSRRKFNTEELNICYYENQTSEDSKLKQDKPDFNKTTIQQNDIVEKSEKGCFIYSLS